MSITGIQNPFFQVRTVSNIQAQLVNLQSELGTGQVSQDWAGLGDGRGLAVTLQNQLAAIGSYGNYTGTSSRLFGLLTAAPIDPSGSFNASVESFYGEVGRR